MTAKNGQKSFSRNNKTKLESCVSMRNRHAKGNTVNLVYGLGRHWANKLHSSGLSV